MLALCSGYGSWYYAVMTTLAQIEAAAEALSYDQKKTLMEWLAERMRSKDSPVAVPHSVLDIPPVSLGNVIRLPSPDDDLLDEMLEERR
jgi:hypothetical protein